MKMTFDNVLVVTMIVIIVLYGFLNGDSSSICKNWEDISIVATLFYAITIYLYGFFNKKFSGLSENQKGFIGIIVFLIIPMISLTFIFGFLKNHFNWALKIYNDHLIVDRVWRMGILVIVAVLFCVVDYIMWKYANTDKINYATNFWYSDIPVTIAFVVLLGYAYYLTYNPTYLATSNYSLANYEHFFEGAIAFQLILSNIVWMYNDDKLWLSILNKEN